MTYVELIVVLSIFAILSSVAIYNYGDFQANVDIKNLASDIALKIVEAQKSSLSGLLPPVGYNPIDSWKPSYGVSFDTATPTQFIYFVDLDNAGDRETLDTIRIVKGNNYIDRINKCTATPCDLNSNPINSLSITFKRPDSGAVFSDTSITGSDYTQIIIKSPKGNTSFIKIYPSGRIQVN